MKYLIAAVLLSISTHSFAGQAPDGSACKVGDKIGLMDGWSLCNSARYRTHQKCRKRSDVYPASKQLLSSGNESRRDLQVTCYCLMTEKIKTPLRSPERVIVTMRVSDIL